MNRYYEDIEQLRSRLAGDSMDDLTAREIGRLLDQLAETRNQLLEIQPEIDPDDSPEDFCPTVYKEDLK